MKKIKIAGFLILFLSISAAIFFGGNLLISDLKTSTIEEPSSTTEKICGEMEVKNQVKISEKAAFQKFAESGKFLQNPQKVSRHCTTKNDFLAAHSDWQNDSNLLFARVHVDENDPNSGEAGTVKYAAIQYDRYAQFLRFALEQVNETRDELEKILEISDKISGWIK